MKSLDRKAFLSAKVDVPTETVEVPELKGTVIVRGMTAKEQTALYRSAAKKGSKSGEVDEDTFAPRLIAACLVDSSGNRLLEDGEWNLVYEKFTSSFSTLAQAAMRVNGLSDRGNSSATDGEGSYSD
jgi:hypothetical protein